MNCLINKTILLAAVGIFAVSSVFAEGISPHPRTDMENATTYEYEQNSEFDTQQSSHDDSIEEGFVQLDADQNGTLTEDEFTAAQSSKQFKEIDNNNDGVVTEQELRDGFAMY